MASNQIRIIVTDLERFIDRLIRKLVLDVVANLRTSADSGYGTPVDTGWARANWVPNIGGKRQAPSGTRESVSSADQNAGVAKVATSYRHQQGPVFISNMVPYIVHLNEGSSRQAPAGFVQNAVTKAVQVDMKRGLAAMVGK